MLHEDVGVTLRLPASDSTAGSKPRIFSVVRPVTIISLHVPQSHQEASYPAHHIPSRSCPCPELGDMNCSWNWESPHLNCIPCAIDGRGLQDLPSSEVIPQHCFPLVRLLQLISVDEKTVDETGFPLAARLKYSANKTEHGSRNQHVKNSPRHSQIPRNLLNSYISVMLPPVTWYDSRSFLPEDEFVINQSRTGDSVRSRAHDHLR
nr:uncharacterized protein LOC110363002 isoform X1 [Columba livia]